MTKNSRQLYSLKIGINYVTCSITHRRQVVSVLVDDESVEEVLRNSKQNTFEVDHVHSVDVVVRQKL